MMDCILTSGLVFTIFCILAFYLLKLKVKSKKRQNEEEIKGKNSNKSKTVGFFHPYCNAGGGGERVLWTAIKAILQKYPEVQCIVYTGDVEAKPEEILNKASQRFNIKLPSSGITFVYLYKRWWVEASRYPFFTLLGQSLGSIILGLEALLSFVPDVYIDSMGYAFTLPLFKFVGNCRVGCYVHYPTISTDMLGKVTERQQSFNNASFISQSIILSNVKLLYYKIFAFLYGTAGRRSNIVMVNSTWTLNHINSIWKVDYKTSIVYPPCDVSEFLTVPWDSTEKSSACNIISVAQFRPEKDHPLQVRSFGSFLLTLPDKEKHKYKLLLVGSCRNNEDSARVDNLRKIAKDIGIEDNVEYHLNVSFAELKRLLSISTIGLHTMWNEHFGIGVVECMAAGTVILAHNSGGPKLDIVTEYKNAKTGFLGDSEESYAQKMAEIFRLNSKQKETIVLNARESVKRFSDTEFENGFLDCIEPLVKCT